MLTKIRRSSKKRIHGLSRHVKWSKSTADLVLVCKTRTHPDTDSHSCQRWLLDCSTAFPWNVKRAKKNSDWIWTQNRGQASPATGGPEGATRKSVKVEINRQLFFTTLRSLFLDSWMKWSPLIFPQQKEALRSTEHTRLRLSDLISSCCSHKLSVTLFVAWLYR